MTADPDDPTYGYFLLYADPPPSSRTLPDVRTDADAIQAAVEVAFDSATAVQLRHHTESGTYLIGSATADGVFTPAAGPDQHCDTQHRVSSRNSTGAGWGGAQFPVLPAGTASTPYDPDDAAHHLAAIWAAGHDTQTLVLRRSLRSSEALAVRPWLRTEAWLTPAAVLLNRTRPSRPSGRTGLVESRDGRERWP